jgi:hypothetical protein
VTLPSPRKSFDSSREAEAHHRIGADARGAQRNSAYRGEFMKRCRTLSRPGEQADFVGDE